MGLCFIQIVSQNICLEGHKHSQPSWGLGIDILGSKLLPRSCGRNGPVGRGVQAADILKVFVEGR